MPTKSTKSPAQKPKPRKEKTPATPEVTAATATVPPPVAPAPVPDLVPPTPDDLVEDDGEMVTRAERDGRRKIREELAAARTARKNGRSPAQEREIETTLDAQAPGWRERAATAKAEKDAAKKARLEKLKADRAAKRATRPASDRSNHETPTPAPEDLAAPAADRTLARLQVRWCEALTRAGKTPTTVAGYRAGIQVAIEHFAETTAVADLTSKKVAAYFESDRVTKTRAGKPAAKPGVDKTRRALRMALVWAVAAGWAPTNPAASAE